MPSLDIIRPFPLQVYILKPAARRVGLEAPYALSSNAVPTAMIGLYDENPEPPALLTRLTTLAREYATVVAFATLCVLALLSGIRCSIWIVLAARLDSCKEYAPLLSRLASSLAAIEPLAVLQITAACGLLAFLAAEIISRIASMSPRWAVARDAEYGLEGTRIDRKASEETNVSLFVYHHLGLR